MFALYLSAFISSSGSDFSESENKMVAMMVASWVGDVPLKSTDQMAGSSRFSCRNNSTRRNNTRDTSTKQPVVYTAMPGYTELMVKRRQMVKAPKYLRK